MASYDDFVYEIVEHVATLRTSNTGWTRELNIVRWNGGVPKYDIRDWPPDHELKAKGVSLTKDEAEKLVAALGAHLAEEEVK